VQDQHGGAFPGAIRRKSGQSHAALVGIRNEFLG
jgi:hypothetical protein